MESPIYVGALLQPSLTFTIICLCISIALWSLFALSVCAICRRSQQPLRAKGVSYFGPLAIFSVFIAWTSISVILATIEQNYEVTTEDWLVRSIIVHKEYNAKNKFYEDYSLPIPFIVPWPNYSTRNPNMISPVENFLPSPTLSYACDLALFLTLASSCLLYLMVYRMSALHANHTAISAYNEVLSTITSEQASQLPRASSSRTLPPKVPSTPSYREDSLSTPLLSGPLPPPPPPPHSSSLPIDPMPLSQSLSQSQPQSQSLQFRQSRRFRTSSESHVFTVPIADGDASFTTPPLTLSQTQTKTDVATGTTRTLATVATSEQQSFPLTIVSTRTSFSHPHAHTPLSSNYPHHPSTTSPAPFPVPRGRSRAATPSTSRHASPQRHSSASRPRVTNNMTMTMTGHSSSSASRSRAARTSMSRSRSRSRTSSPAYDDVTGGDYVVRMGVGNSINTRRIGGGTGTGKSTMLGQPPKQITYTQKYTWFTIGPLFFLLLLLCVGMIPVLVLPSEYLPLLLAHFHDSTAVPSSPPSGFFLLLLLVLLLSLGTNYTSTSVKDPYLTVAHGSMTSFLSSILVILFLVFHLIYQSITSGPASAADSLLASASTLFVVSSSIFQLLLALINLSLIVLLPLALSMKPRVYCVWPSPTRLASPQEVLRDMTSLHWLATFLSSAPPGATLPPASIVPLWMEVELYVDAVRDITGTQCHNTRFGGEDALAEVGICETCKPMSKSSAYYVHRLAESLYRTHVESCRGLFLSAGCKKSLLHTVQSERADLHTFDRLTAEITSQLTVAHAAFLQSPLLETCKNVMRMQLNLRTMMIDAGMLGHGD